jgi:hypothetical protein
MVLTWHVRNRDDREHQCPARANCALCGMATMVTPLISSDQHRWILRVKREHSLHAEPANGIWLAMFDPTLGCALQRSPFTESKSPLF